MITIQGFAKLCGCNTQTLRYYDRIGLLIPAKVDGWTGYRYYEEEQALRFLKIKNLQQADFSIDEIRPLLDEDGDRLQEAFERKIAEQQEKLERIRKIQNSYLKEKMEMQDMLRMLTELVEGRTDDPKLWEEFGLDDAQGAGICAKAHEIAAEWLTQIRDMSGEIARQAGNEDLEAMKAVFDALTAEARGDKKLIFAVADENADIGNGIPADAETVFERSGWEHVSEWIGCLPEPVSGKKNFFLFSVREDSPVCDPGFPTMMLAVMAAKYNVMQDGVYCNVAKSGDGLNHFTLMRK